jgi:hypothetical protein
VTLLARWGDVVFSFDVVFLDLTPDPEGGLVLAQLLRSHNVRVIITMSRECISPARFVTLLQELMMGDIQFLPRPYTFDEFHTVAFKNSPTWLIKHQV